MGSVVLDLFIELLYWVLVFGLVFTVYLWVSIYVGVILLHVMKMYRLDETLPWL